ncbi:unnamed protein product [Miscanthus lutarioriparius]|uniref:non-specific serine/threonine protein kinase n=1 Tax=Miscanthus lutarioriparius TaxID=422564 RepID=A0A811R9V9_9POAL|nr:unnamed protein product [Miscanthus lutarioriparius]
MTKVNFSFQSNLTVVHSILFADIPITGNVKIYSSKEMRKATRNFCPENKLGQGSFGRVFLACGIRFDWRTRVKICIGVADGLTYLHEEVRPPIVHRDIKASNILLDRNLRPKTEDFGLANFFPGNKTHISTRVAGTLFGVLLLEIVSGRCHTDPRLPFDEQFLLEKVWTLTEEARQLLKIGLLVAKMLKGACAVSDKIMRPGLITDVMDLRVRTVEQVQFSLCPSMSPALSSSLVSTLALACSTVVESP